MNRSSKKYSSVQEMIVKRVLSEVAPIFMVLIAIANIALIIDDSISSSHYIPGFIALFSILFTLLLLKRDKIKYAKFFYIGSSYFAVIVGMVINGGIYAPVSTILIGLGATLFIYFSTKKAVILLLLQIVVFYFISLNFSNQKFISDFSAIERYLLLLVSLLLFTHSLYITISIARDTFGELQKSEEKLVHQKDYLETIINSIGEGLITVDNDFKVRHINKLIENYLHKESEEIVDYEINSILTIYDLENNEINIIEAIELSPFYKENIKVNSLNSNRRFSLAVYPIHTPDSSGGTVIIISDITKELILKEQSDQSNRMEAIGQLTSGVAHDFNNLLGGILGSAELLKGASSDEVEEYRCIIIKAAKRASDLTGKLLDFSRKGKLVSTSININATILETVDVLSRTIDKRIEIRTKLLSEDVTVVGDENQIENALLNIGINASQAIEGQGIIRFITRRVYLDKERCLMSSTPIVEGEYVQISVEDTGVGIEQDKLKKIFEPFYTTKEQGKGTGLGLAAVYGMVESHKGTIVVDSELGVGTTFHIYLPLNDKQKIEGAVKAKVVPLNLTPKIEKILVVDDEEVMRETAKLMLSHSGYNVDTAKNGVEAIDLYQANRYDLVLLDMVMPIMDGKKTFEELVKIDSKVNVIIASGFTQEDDVMALESKGLKGFIRKPYTYEDLSSIIESSFS